MFSCGPRFAAPVLCLQLGNDTCAAQGLTGALLQACAVDVAVGNNTAIANATGAGARVHDLCCCGIVEVNGHVLRGFHVAVYQPGCPNACSGRGTCVNGHQCDCIPGWTGDACETGLCNPQCPVHSTCRLTLSAKVVVGVVRIVIRSLWHAGCVVSGAVVASACATSAGWVPTVTSNLHAPLSVTARRTRVLAFASTTTFASVETGLEVSSECQWM